MKTFSFTKLDQDPTSPRQLESFDFPIDKDPKQSIIDTYLNKRRKVVFFVWALALIVGYFAIDAKNNYLPPPFEPSIKAQTFNSTGKITRLASKTPNRLLCNLDSDKSANFFCQSNFVADVLDLAWVILPLFSCRGIGSEDQRLYNLHKNFVKYLNAYGIQNIQIEAIKKDSNETYNITRPNNEPFEMQTYYHKCHFMRNNLINKAIRNLDRPWEYMLWADAHQYFENHLWIFEAIVKAEKYAVVQLFEKSIYFQNNNQTDFERPGFVAASSSPSYDPSYIFEFGAGFILRRELYEKLGYLIDECIAGDCDHIYNQAAFGNISWELSDFYPRYSKSLQPWLKMATPIMNEGINATRGFVEGNIIHFQHQHGSFPFEKLHQALEWLEYDRERDLKRDENFTLYISNETISNTVEHLFKRVSEYYKLAVDDREKEREKKEKEEADRLYRP